MPFEFVRTAIQDVVLIKPHFFEDDRGFFIKGFHRGEFEKFGIRFTPAEINHSKSAHGVLRGLHFQRGQHAEAKLVRCIRGTIFDVAVDLRKESPTFGKYVAAVLSQENKHMLFIPRCFAHGFLVISKDGAEVLYISDNLYSPENEGGLIWNDSQVGIAWPLNGVTPTLSQKDQQLPTLKELAGTPGPIV